MNGSALIMMLVAIILVWGGLAASISYLRARPEVTEGPGSVDPDLEETPSAQL